MERWSRSPFRWAEVRSLMIFLKFRQSAALCQFNALDKAALSAKVIVECDLPPGSNTGFHDFYRKEAEEAMSGPAPVSESSVDGRQPDEVDLIVPPGVRQRLRAFRS